jgi:hypothetical protein
MRAILTSMTLALAMVLCAGCGDDGEGDGDGDGDGSGSGDSSSSQTCEGTYGCINGACQCETGANKGKSCCDPDDMSCTENKCDSFCKQCS